MRRMFGVVAWGILGAVLAAALMGGAFVLAGTSLTEPASAVHVTTEPPLRPHTSEHHEAEPTPTPDRADSSSAPPAPSVVPSVATAVEPASTSPLVAPADDGGAERGDD